MKSQNSPRQITRAIIFNSKWMLVLVYFGLIVAQGLYAYKFLLEVKKLLLEFNHLDENGMVIAVLGLVDLAMVANLIQNIITGSFQNFVDKESVSEKDRTSSGMLKIKMGMSLVGISSVHLLKVFMEGTTNAQLYPKLYIHAAFVLGTLVLAIIEWLHHKPAPETGAKKEQTNSH